MNHLVVKTKGRDGKIFKLFSDKQVYELPIDLDNPKPYNSDYKLEDDEWFYIPEFSKTSFCIDFLKKKFISTDYAQMSDVKIENLHYLCSYQTGVYFFQNVTPSLIIRKKWFKFTDSPVLEDNAPIITINDRADAIYIKSTDTLYFKKLAAITTIFKGIIELYKEATQAETEDFLKSSFIHIENDYDSSKVKTANRKRIALAMETFKNFSATQKKTIFDYIKEYCKSLPFDAKKMMFTITGEEDLKDLLWGIEQRYYTTPIGNEKMVANSVSKID